MNDKARVAAAAAPKTRISNAVIASDAPLVDTWAVVGKAVDRETGLKLGTTLVGTDVGLRDVLVAAVGDDVIFDEDDEDKRPDPVEEAKGGAIAREGLASRPVPQGIAAPSSG